MGETPNNRVTTQQFYEAQLETNKTIAALALTQSEERAAMERRLTEKIGGVPTQVGTNKEEIDKLRKENTTRSRRGYFWDGVNSLGILITGLLAALKGS